MPEKISLINKADDLISVSQGTTIPFIIWCFWYNDQMNENRIRGFEMMRMNLGVPLCLISKENLNEFILPEFPLHPAFNWLSDVHKSDYMRIYLLHHYGGGWHDIKPTQVNFSPAWEVLYDPNVYLIGKPEVKKGPARVFDREGRWMPDYWQDLVGCGWWVGRPRTPLSSEMYHDLHELLDKNHEALKKYPAKNPYAKKKKSKFAWLPFNLKNEKGYPLQWTVFGDIFHPLNYKYRHHINRTLPADKIKNSGLPYR